MENVTVNVTAVTLESKPLLFVMKYPETLSVKARTNLLEVMAKVKAPIEERLGIKIPCIILEDGITLELILDPRPVAPVAPLTECERCGCFVPIKKYEGKSSSPNGGVFYIELCENCASKSIGYKEVK